MILTLTYFTYEKVRHFSGICQGISNFCVFQIPNSWNTVAFDAVLAAVAIGEIRDGEDALRVNWLEIEAVNKAGNMT